MNEGFVFRGSGKQGAFGQFIDDWRKPLQTMGQDLFADVSTQELSRKKLDALLSGGDPEAATVVPSHNDAVVQGLSEVPDMQIEKWGNFHSAPV